jgi:hypothetical protein
VKITAEKLINVVEDKYNTLCSECGTYGFGNALKDVRVEVIKAGASAVIM